MTLTPIQTFLIILAVTVGTVITRFLPFLLFQVKKKTNIYMDYLGKVLPYSAIGLLVVYCLKGVRFCNPSYGIPEIVSILCIILLHHWKENTLLSIGLGTIIYMVLVQYVF